MSPKPNALRAYAEPGEVLLGKYQVTSLVGQGGMGVVIKARHLDLDEDVAIKCLRPELVERQDIVQRFLREAKAAVKLKGEHIARVLDVGRLENDVPYIVMEFLEGADLNAIIKHHGAQDPPVAVDLILQACEALAEAHSLGIVHRDIKSSNFFISQPENQAANLKVLDFGIATAPEGASELTSTQSVIGTPAYMSPEQMRSTRVADVRSDIWSLGVVLYELLEGARPFRSEVYSDLCLKVGMDPPEPIRNTNVSEALVAVVYKCLEKPIERRYQSVAELAFDLLPFAPDPVRARAIAEQCARLLGRRSTKSLEALGRSDDTTPVPDARQRATPSSTYSATDSGVLEQSGAGPPRASSAPTVLGHPTPAPSMQPKTPTSIHTGYGQLVTRNPPAVRRGLMIGLTALTLVTAGVIATLVLDRKGSSDTDDQFFEEPAATKQPNAIKADPAKTDESSAQPDSTATDVKADATKTGDDATANAKTNATAVTTDSKTDPKSDADSKTSKKQTARVVKQVVKKRPAAKDPSSKKDSPKSTSDGEGEEMFKKRE